MKLIYDLSDPNVKTDTEIINRIFKDVDTLIAVVTKHTTESGAIKDCKIELFDTYADACDSLNKYQYIPNYVVNAYEATRDHYTSIVTKCYDSTSYFRFAMVEPRKYDHFVFCDLLRMGATIYK